MQVLAKSRDIPLRAIAVDIHATMDRSRPVRPDVSLFNSVPLLPHERCHRGARPSAGGGLQRQVTALRHGRSSTPDVRVELFIEKISEQAA